jgi:hypothetical protein
MGFFPPQCVTYFTLTLFRAVKINGPVSGPPLPAPCHRPLAAHAAASQPQGSDHGGTDDAAGGHLAPETDHPPSLAERSLCRHTGEVGSRMRRHRWRPELKAHRRWRGKRSEPVRLDVRDHHTRSLYAQSPAQTEQWCCWCCYRRSIFGSGEIAAVVPSQRCRSKGPERLLKILAALGPSRISPAAQLKRE